jgi:hypothetical protein
MKLLRTAVVVTIAVLAPSAPANADLTPAARSLSTCLQDSKRLSALILVDESASLQKTDRDDRRVYGIGAALAGLAELAATEVDGRAPAVDVLLASFAAGVSPDPLAEEEPRWRRVTEDSLADLLAQADAYGARESGESTDYTAALVGAQRLLARRAARDRTTEPCRAVIWFTDGEYLLQGQSAAVVNAAKQRLCRRAGLLDRIAGDGIVKFTVGLGLEPAHGRFLRRITTGTGAPCGSRVSPATGEYFPVRDAGKLFLAFAALFSPEVRPRDVPVCDRSACEAGTRGFATVEGLARFQLTASTGEPGTELVLRGPTGAPAPLRADAGRVTVAGVPVTQRWVSDEDVIVKGDLRGAAGRRAAGAWQFAFVDPNGGAAGRTAAYDLRLYADLAPELEGDPNLVRGRKTPVTVELVREDESVAPAGPLLDAARISASLDRLGAVDFMVTGDGAYAASPSVPADWESQWARLDVSVSFEELGPQTPVMPLLRRFKIQTPFPPEEGWPTVTPSELRLESIAGTGSTRGVLTVTGGRARGCAWIPPATVQGPGGVSVSYKPRASAAECLAVGPGEQREIVVMFTAAEETTGTVRADLPVRLRSEVAGAVGTTEIPASFELFPPPDIAKRVSIIVALVLLAALFPVLLLYLLNLLTARFTASQKLLALARDVRVRTAGGVENAEGGPLSARYNEFDAVDSQGEAKRERRLRLDDDLLDCRTRAIGGGLKNGVFGLLRGPFAVVSAPGRPVLAATEPPRKLRSWRDGSEREVPLALNGTWVFVPMHYEEAKSAYTLSGGGEEDEPLEWVDGRLVLVIDGVRGDHEQGTELLQAAARTLRTHKWDTTTVEPKKEGPKRRLWPRRQRPEEPAGDWPYQDDPNGAQEQQNGGGRGAQS